jgi:RecB family exonuclease
MPLLLPTPQVTPLRSLSPSRYKGMRECLLREALSYVQAKSYIPSSPKGALGSVIHKLIEEASKGEVEPDKEACRKRWDELIMQAEKKLPLFQVPLSRSCGEYAVLKASSILAAVRNYSAPKPPGTLPWNRLYGQELEFQTKDHTLRGRIDDVLASESGPVIRDYKTGSILDPESLEVKEDYKMQLKLYSAIYADQTGIWPVKAELISIEGRSFEVTIDSGECAALADEAKSYLEESNRLLAQIQNGVRPPEDAAKPSPRACWFCPYRPCCAAYTNVPKENTPDNPKWPHDIWGTVDSKADGPNGKWIAKLTRDSVSIVIRRLSKNRYDDYNSFVTGSIAAFYSLKLENAPNTFQEGPSTVLLVS